MYYLKLFNFFNYFIFIVLKYVLRFLPASAFGGLILAGGSSKSMLLSTVQLFKDRNLIVDTSITCLSSENWLSRFVLPKDIVENKWTSSAINQLRMMFRAYRPQMLTGRREYEYVCERARPKSVPISLIRYCF